jgi:hypothetical protein
VTGPPCGRGGAAASTHENRASELMLEHMTQQSVTGRLDLVLVDRDVAAAATRALGRSRRLANTFESTITTPAECQMALRERPFGSFAWPAIERMLDLDGRVSVPSKPR